MNRTPLNRRTQIINCVVEGNSIRSTERMTNTHRDTIMRLMVEVGGGCANLMNEEMRDLLSTAAGICTGAAAQKCTTGSVVACPCSPWEGPARGATRPRRGWRRPARGRGLWAHGDKRGVIRTVAGVVTGSA